VECREEVIRAWVRRCDGAEDMDGWTVGVKDIIDTVDFPTEYGSPIYAGHQPTADAACVAMLRAAGAVVVGKTVTAELAMFSPGPTRNPHRISHTPGGSSSGSAAAVAAGHVQAALGSQTGGSVIRPASFCGVYGLKPTFGVVPTDGVKAISPSQDAVGWYARNLDDLEQVAAVFGIQPNNESPRVGFVRTEQWTAADPASRAAVEAAADKLDAVEVQLPDAMVGLAVEQQVVQGYEAARSLAWEFDCHRSALSASLAGILEWGAAIADADYQRVLDRAAEARQSWFEGLDVVVTPAVVGEAPEGLAATGDPRFCRLWNLLGWPALSVPGAVGATGLPIGVQLVASAGGDGLVMATARRLVS
jgi:Asp-tRNA(Asn)/Glu-tRNA(Gln) amidotransferase A subunit family amidase